jgi:hydrogenase nickel incorporation protein HypA/HybF
MHELIVTENILEIALKHAKQAGASKVTDIHLVIGNLSSIVDDSVSFYWNIISEDTICNNANLHIKRIPAELQCTDCGKQYAIDSGLSPCPACGSTKVKVISGEEFWLDSIEIEKED